MNSPFLDGKVERDAGLDGLPVLEVSEEADGDVEAGDGDHGGVEHAVPAAQRARLGHLVLQRQDDADALEGVDGRAEVQGKLAPKVGNKLC